MAKLADAADLKSADLYRPWGFKSPSGHQQNKRLIYKIASRELGLLRTHQRISRADLAQLMKVNCANFTLLIKEMASEGWSLRAQRARRCAAANLPGKPLKR